MLCPSVSRYSQATGAKVAPLSDKAARTPSAILQGSQGQRTGSAGIVAAAIVASCFRRRTSATRLRREKKSVLSATDGDLEASPVCVCGAGNASHAFIPLLKQAGFGVNVFVDFEDCAARLEESCEQNDGILVQDKRNPNDVKEIRGKPDLVSRNAAEVVPQCDVVIVALPSFALKPVFESLKPHLKHGATIICMPGQGACEIVAKDVFGESLKDGTLTFAGIVPMPLNCRIQEWGKVVSLNAVKFHADLATLPADQSSKVADIVSNLLDCPVRGMDSFLGLALNGGNGNMHPARLMGSFSEHAEGTTYSDNGMYFEGWDESAAKWTDMISDERLAIYNAICDLYPSAGKPGQIPTMRDYMAKIYGPQIQDPSSTIGVFATNDGLKGYQYPMKQAGDVWELDFTHRYFREDVPDALCIYKGYAELAGVETPGIDAILSHFQKFLGKEYIKQGRLIGKDSMDTKAPQAFGIKSLDELFS